MGANGFREEELVSRRVKIGNEWQTRTFPIVAGRLRLAHEENQNLSPQTELVNWDGQHAVFKCSAVTGKGQFIGYGTANNQRDERLADSLVELADTRSIARALRFAGYGMEYIGAEEVSLGTNAEPDGEQNGSKTSAPAFSEGNGKEEAKAPSVAAAETEPKPKNVGIDHSTQAQCRALYALAGRANFQEANIGEMLARFGKAEIGSSWLGGCCVIPRPAGLSRIRGTMATIVSGSLRGCHGKNLVCQTPRSRGEVTEQ